MGEYGYATNEELQRLTDFLISEISVLSDILKNRSLEASATGLFEGIVLKQAVKDSEEEKTFGYGAIKVSIPKQAIFDDTDFWVRPLRIAQGRFEIPPVDSFVNIIALSDGGIVTYRYFGSDFLDRDGLYSNFSSKEEIGFQPSIPPVRGVVKSPSQYVDDVRSKPGKIRIIESSKDILILENSEDKELTIAVNDSWKLNLEVGDGGEVNIENKNPKTGTAGTGADFKVKMGTGGTIEFEAGAATLEKMILGETLKDLLNDILDKIKLITVPTAVGPSGTPDNASDFTAIQAQLPTILSSKIKNN